MQFQLVLMVVAVSANMWTYGPALPASTDNVAASVLGDGTVMVVGGAGLSSTLGQTLSLSNRSAWQVLPSIPQRYAHTLTLLGSGKLLAVGGWTPSPSNQALSDALLFDPVTSTWSPTPNMALPRQRHTSTLLANGNVLVCGGAQSASASTSACEIFNVATGTFVAATANMAQARYNHVASLLGSGKVLLAGGSPLTSSADLYDPAVGTFAATGAMAIARQQHSCIRLLDGRVLVLGGTAAGGEAQVSCEIYDPSTGVWSMTTSMSMPRSDASPVLKDSFVFIAGGYGVSGNLAVVERYDPTASTWTTLAPLQVARSRHALVQLPNGDLMVIGGFGGAATTEILVFTAAPTLSPTFAPTLAPTTSPTLAPTSNPTLSPTANPTTPTLSPTSNPTTSPTRSPTSKPTTLSPTSNPTTLAPTSFPTTLSPTSTPSRPTGHPVFCCSSGKALSVSFSVLVALTIGF